MPILGVDISSKGITELLTSSSLDLKREKILRHNQHFFPCLYPDLLQLHSVDKKVWMLAEKGFFHVSKPIELDISDSAYLSLYAKPCNFINIGVPKN